jgi:hypothetical protein
MPSARISQGTHIGIKVPPASVYTTIGWVEDISADYSVGSVETTILASTTKTYIPGLFDGGEVTFSVQYVTFDATVAEFQTLIATPVICSWQITYPDACTEVFSGFVTKLGPSAAGVEDIITADITVQVTGAVVFTAGTS